MPPGDAPVTFMVAAHRDFHSGIVSGSGKERLQRCYEAIESEIELLLVSRQRYYENPKEIVRELEHLIACLKTREFAAACDVFLEYAYPFVRKMRVTERQAACSKALRRDRFRAFNTSQSH
ncbi:FCD domain-containing protein [Paraburkholderia hospita]|jgi:DNA-binding GntR family transcriptional regulator|nr:FCD domain-containing protein [Paraburkholderia hospita]